MIPNQWYHAVLALNGDNGVAVLRLHEPDEDTKTDIRTFMDDLSERYNDRIWCGFTSPDADNGWRFSLKLEN
jgi:hypothetical protein